MEDGISKIWHQDVDRYQVPLVWFALGLTLFQMTQAGAMTEDQARAALRAFVAVGELERWIADQRWEPIPGGWRVRERFQGWHFRVEPVAGGLHVVMSARGGEPAVWTVPAG